MAAIISSFSLIFGGCCANVRREAIHHELKLTLMQVYCLEAIVK